MQSRELCRKLHRITMPPGPPKTVLAAIVTMVRAPPRELHHDSAPFSVIRIPTVIDQLPSDAIGIEIGNDWRRSARHHLSAITTQRAYRTPLSCVSPLAEHNPRYVFQCLLLRER